MMIRFGVLAASALTVLAYSNSAAAQEAPSPAAGAPVPAAENTGVGDIIVTAQRRTENVQKSSLSIQVLGSAALQRAGVTQAADLNALVPGIQIAPVGSVVQVFLRGVGDNSTNPLASPAVAFNIDGVYIARPTSISGNFFDIDRIEVLKGPQGTLYGRNASGGAVNLITASPKLHDDGGYFELEGGNYALKRVSGAFNKAFGDTFAVRAAFQVIDRKGYLSDGSADEKANSARVRALWEPNSDITLHLNFDASDARGLGGGSVLLSRLPGESPWLSINSPSSAARILAATSAIPVIPGFAFTQRDGLISNGVPRQDNSFINGSAQLDWNLGPATLTVLPAYRHAKEDYNSYVGFQFGVKNISNQSSLEVRLAHVSDRLKWVLGGYYFDERQNSNVTSASNLYLQNLDESFRLKTQAYAFFGDATFSVTPKFRLLGGLRYTSEKPTLGGVNRNGAPLTNPYLYDPVFNPLGLNLFRFNSAPPFNLIPDENVGGTFANPASIRFSDVTWKAGAEYDLSSSNLLFATASTGFKAGGLNPSAYSAAPGSRSVFKPEKLTAFTIGSRNRFLDNRLQINLEAFYWKYRDKQEANITVSDAGYFDFLRSNAGRATLKGGSIDITAKPTNADTLHLYVEYNDAKYQQFDLFIPLQFSFGTVSTCPQTQVTLSGQPFVDYNCAGRQVTRAPKWTGSFDYDHQFDLASGATLTANVNAQFSSPYFLSSEYTPNEHTTSYGLINAALTFVSSSKSWSFTGYVKNITNHPVYTQGVELPLQGTLVAANVNAPRTYGARLRFNF